MPYSFTLTTTIPASPQEVYEAWLDSLAHSEMTGGAATMSDVVGAEVSAWDSYITGRNIELVPGERIVQSWRTSEFGEEHEDSIITLTLEPVEGGTLLTLEHSNVPEEHRSYEEGGWQENYFEPMVAYFNAREQTETEAPVEEAAPPAARPRRARGAPKKPAKRAAKRTEKSARKAKPKSARKAKRAAAPRAKAATKKRKSSRKAAATASRRGVKSRRRKSTRRKGR
jgi:uncharacterized protein YndB with AHSA1/START domain